MAGITLDRHGQIWLFTRAEKPGEVNWLHAVAVDSDENLYVGDIKGQRAQKLVRQR
jgi:hypothetical protein